MYRVVHTLQRNGVTLYRGVKLSYCATKLNMTWMCLARVSSKMINLHRKVHFFGKCNTRILLYGMGLLYPESSPAALISVEVTEGLLTQNS